MPAIVHFTPANSPEYFIVTVPGRGDLCRTFTDQGGALSGAAFFEALAYQRSL